MFLPGNIDKMKKQDEESKDALRRVERWCLEMIDVETRERAVVAAREIACGDPTCSPIDTAITIVYGEGTHGIFGVPMMAKEVTQEKLKMNFPAPEVLEKWSKGIDADWPPQDDGECDDAAIDDDILRQLPQCRFEVGTRVFCRVGPDAEKDWIAGEIIKLWYHEVGWPRGSYAPYQIRLDDDRKIFAPADMDEIIKAET